MGQDFILSRTEVTFDEGSTSGNSINIFVDILNDTLVEGTENFTLTGSVAPPASFSGSITISIIDNDGKWVYLYISVKMSMKILQCYLVDLHIVRSILIIGASLGEPHTNALHVCVFLVTVII